MWLQRIANVHHWSFPVALERALCTVGELHHHVEVVETDERAVDALPRIQRHSHSDGTPASIAPRECAARR